MRLFIQKTLCCLFTAFSLSHISQLTAHTSSQVEVEKGEYEFETYYTLQKPDTHDPLTVKVKVYRGQMMGGNCVHIFPTEFQLTLQCDLNGAFKIFKAKKTSLGICVEDISPKLQSDFSDYRIPRPRPCCGALVAKNFTGKLPEQESDWQEEIRNFIEVLAVRFSSIDHYEKNYHFSNIGKPKSYFTSLVTANKSTGLTNSYLLRRKSPLSRRSGQARSIEVTFHTKLEALNEYKGKEMMVTEASFRTPRVWKWDKRRFKAAKKYSFGQYARIKFVQTKNGLKELSRSNVSEVAIKYWYPHVAKVAKKSFRQYCRYRKTHLQMQNKKQQS